MTMERGHEQPSGFFGFCKVVNHIVDAERLKLLSK